MKTLNLYVTKSCIITLLMSIGLLTFAVVGSRMIEVIKLLSQGGSMFAAMKMLFYFIPYAMALAVPLGFLVTVMLVFGRLSADNEITAMRACGISVLQIVSPIIIAAFLLSFGCLYLQLFASPRYAAIARGMIREVLKENPAGLLEPGRQTSAGDMSFYVQEKDANNVLKFIDIYRTQPIAGTSRREPIEHIKAQTGEITIDEQNETLELKMQNVTVVKYDQRQRQEVHFKSFFIPVKYGMLLDRSNLQKSPSYQNVNELFGSMEYTQSHMRVVDNPEQLNALRKEYTKLEIELNRRFALGLSPIAFLLIGLPLAIRSSRRETSVGLFFAAGLAVVYLVGVTILGQLSSFPQIYPQYLLWLPALIYECVGAWLLYRLVKQ